MNYSEFRTMTTALERYYKDVKIAILTGKRNAKDLDMRYLVRFILELTDRSLKGGLEVTPPSSPKGPSRAGLTVAVLVSVSGFTVVTINMQPIALHS